MSVPLSVLYLDSYKCQGTFCGQVKQLCPRSKYKWGAVTRYKTGDIVKQFEQSGTRLYERQYLSQSIQKLPRILIIKYG